MPEENDLKNDVQDDVITDTKTDKKPEDSEGIVPDHPNREVIGTLFLILQVGITMIVTLGLCFAAGYLLDKHFGTRLLWIFILLGILSGYKAVYTLVQRYIKGRSDESRQPEWAKRAFHPDAPDPEGPGSGEDAR